MKKNKLEPAVKKRVPMPDLGRGAAALIGAASSMSGRIGQPSGNMNFPGMAGLYDFEETLGKGHFAVVKAAKHVFTGERVAVKIIDKTKLDAISQKALLKEVLCMKLVQHPNVVRLYEVIDTSTKMYLVLELGQGDLYDLILKQQGGLSEELGRKYFCQILAAVSYCHKLHVAHRDLKPENVVFFPQVGLVKLTDFGFSNKFCPGVKLDTSCGSLAYSAPEILLGDAYDAPAVDIWSLGVILYMLVVGRAPFQEANDSETLTMIMDVKYAIPSHVSKECADLISRMLRRRPDDRIPLDGIENHAWIMSERKGLSADSEETIGYTEPLVSLHRLKSEERNWIIQEMIKGNIATHKEQILTSVENQSAYDHLASTFYLLAEKLLRERRKGSSSPGLASQASGGALTASLESLHDRRKNSGQSDTDGDVGLSGEEDSLAPLDLEMSVAQRGAAAASGMVRSSSASGASSSRLTELCEGPGPSTSKLPVLLEDPHHTSYSDDEDVASLQHRLRLATTPSGHHQHRSRGAYGGRGNTRRMVLPPQRSTSCSSSEDEDSEKKKRSLSHPPKHKGKTSTSSTAALRAKFFNQRDGDSSDEQSGAGGGGGGSLMGTSGSVVGHLPVQTEESSEETHHHQDGGNADHQETSTGTSCCDITYYTRNDDADDDASEASVLEKSSTSSPYGDVSRGDCMVGNDTTLTSKNVRSVDKGAMVMSKSRVWLSWFFLRRRGTNTKKSKTASNKCLSDKQSVEEDGLSLNSSCRSNGIYKTRSCAELKLRHCSSNNINMKFLDVNQNV